MKAYTIAMQEVNNTPLLGLYIHGLNKDVAQTLHKIQHVEQELQRAEAAAATAHAKAQANTSALTPLMPRTDLGSSEEPSTG